MNFLCRKSHAPENSSISQDHIGSVKKQKSDIIELEAQLNLQQKEFSDFQENFKNEQALWMSKFSSLKNSINILENRNTNSLRTLSNKLAIMVLFLLSFVSFICFISYYLYSAYKNALENKKLAETDPSQLLNKIASPKEFMTSRMNAINLISDKQLLLNIQGVNDIHNTVKYLENSNFKSDQKIASNLRLLLDSHELCLSEQRGLDEMN